MDALRYQPQWAEADPNKIRSRFKPPQWYRTTHCHTPPAKPGTQPGEPTAHCKRRETIVSVGIDVVKELSSKFPKTTRLHFSHHHLGATRSAQSRLEVCQLFRSTLIEPRSRQPCPTSLSTSERASYRDQPRFASDLIHFFPNRPETRVSGGFFAKPHTQMETTGIEPATPALQTRCSPN